MHDEPITNNEHYEDYNLFEDYEFLADNIDSPASDFNTSPWKVLIVDDDDDIQALTSISLEDYRYKNRNLSLLHAYNSKEAKQALEDNPDIAFILLDVVMETRQAGLNIIKYIRERHGNKLVRIVLRTGFPGDAPEREVIENYEINGYEHKDGLTQERLITLVTIGLRDYNTVRELDDARQTLRLQNLNLDDQNLKLEIGQKQLDIQNQKLLDINSQSEKKNKELQLLIAQIEKLNTKLFDQNEQRKAILESAALGIIVLDESLSIMEFSYPDNRAFMHLFDCDEKLTELSQLQIGPNAAIALQQAVQKLQQENMAQTIEIQTKRNTFRAYLSVWNNRELKTTGVSIMLADVSNIAELNRILESKNKELESKNVELQQLNQKLQSGIAKLEQQNTKLRQLTERLENSESNFKFVTYNAQTALFSYNEAGQIDFINEYARSFFGLPANKTENISLLDLGFNLSQAMYLGKRFENVLYSHKKIRMQYKWQRSKNQTSYLDILVHLLNQPDTRHPSALVLMHDISSIKKVEERLLQMNAQLEEDKKQKNMFLSRASHLIRTKLNSVVGFSNLLVSKKMDAGKETRYIRLINNATNGLLFLVNDLIDIAQLDSNTLSIKPQNCKLNNLLDDIYKQFSQHAHETNKAHLSLQIHKSLTEPDANLILDPERLRQVISNLLSNAFKYTNFGKIEFGCQRKDDDLLFFVKDTGVGIEENDRKEIFNRFKTDIKPDLSRNSGLGMSVVEGIVHLMGGTIWLESETGRGSSFYFTVPYMPVYNKTTQNLTAIGTLRHTILVAEDEMLNYIYLEELLQEEQLGNIRILHTKNGQETVNVYKENPNIDLILMDIKMPVMDGYQAARQIKAINPNVPVIAQSAYALAGEVAAYGDIFDDYLIKPITEESIFDLLHKYLSK